MSRDFYPPLADLKHNFNDAPARVTWRAKQVIDFALMFTHARPLSECYVQIEDDVICAPDFVTVRRHRDEIFYVSMKERLTRC